MGIGRYLYVYYLYDIYESVRNRIYYVACGIYR